MLNTDAAADSGSDETPHVATDGTTWIALWSSNQNLGGITGTDYDVLYSVSSDAGASWSAPASLKRRRGIRSCCRHRAAANDRCARHLARRNTIRKARKITTAGASDW